MISARLFPRPKKWVVESFGLVEESNMALGKKRPLPEEKTLEQAHGSGPESLKILFEKRS